MITTSRRTAMMGALASPALASFAHWGPASAHASASPALIYDPNLEAGRIFAKTAESQGQAPFPIQGDRIRFTKDVLTKKPKLIAGIGRYADFLLIADAAYEAAYTSAAILHSHDGLCHTSECQLGWKPLSRISKNAEKNWPVAFVNSLLIDQNDFPKSFGKFLEKANRDATLRNSDQGLILAWILIQTSRQL